MTIALVDDSSADRDRLKQILNQYAAIHRLDLDCQCFASGEALLAAYQPFQYTLIFLDIYMDGMTGIETAERLRAVDDDVLLIFLTTSEAHRPSAFSLFASAYLVKPCGEETVFRTMDHLLRLKTEQDGRFVFSYDRQEHSLRFAELVSLVTQGNYLQITSRDGTVYRTRMTASAAEQVLDERFLVLMKGVIVNQDYVSQIAEGACQLHGGAVLPVNLKRQKELQQKLLNYKFAKIRRDTLAGEGQP